MIIANAHSVSLCLSLSLCLPLCLPPSLSVSLSVSLCLSLSLQVKFLDVDEEAGKLVVSQKRAVMDGVTFDLKKGAVVQGTITGKIP